MSKSKQTKPETNKNSQTVKMNFFYSQPKKPVERLFKVTQKNQGQTIFLTREEMAEQKQHYPADQYTIEVINR